MFSTLERIESNLPYDTTLIYLYFTYLETRVYCSALQNGVVLRTMEKDCGLQMNILRKILKIAYLSLQRDTNTFLVL